ncbi:MAG: hypothetical protein ABW051_03865 [Burkholderiaceae bacterium]
MTIPYTRPLPENAMDRLAERIAPAALIAAGVATALPPAVSLMGMPWTSPFALALMHSHLLVALLGTGLVAAAFIPGLRLAAIAAAALSKTAFVVLALAAPASRQDPALFLSVHAEIAAIAALAAMGVFYWRAAVREMRWNGLVPLRRDS